MAAVTRLVRRLARDEPQQETLLHSAGVLEGMAAALSSHTSALPSAASAPAMAAAGGGGNTCAAAPGHPMSRSRSTSHLSSWTAKQLWNWKNKAGSTAGGKAGAVVTAAAASGGAGYGTVTEEGGEDGATAGAADAAVVSAVSAPAAVDVLPCPVPVLTSPAAVGPAAVLKAAELLAAAAAAHAADKEVQEPLVCSCWQGIWAAGTSVCQGW